MRGGVIEHVYMRDVTVGQVADSIVLADFFYEEGDTGTFTPVLRDIEVRNVTSQKSRYALRLRGYPHAPINDVRVIDCVFDQVAEAGRARRRQGHRADQCPRQRRRPERTDRSALIARDLTVPIAKWYYLLPNPSGGRSCPRRSAS